VNQQTPKAAHGGQLDVVSGLDEKDVKHHVRHVRIVLQVVVGSVTRDYTAHDSESGIAETS